MEKFTIYGKQDVYPRLFGYFVIIDTAHTDGAVELSNNIGL